MKRNIGILVLVVVVFCTAAIGNENFLSPYNIENLLQRIGLFGILGIAAAFTIITGGIDLSIGSVVGLVGCLVPYLITHKQLSPAGSIFCVFALLLAIGLAHGLLITKLRLQPFIVTLCGLLLYRGLARWITGDANQGFGRMELGLKWLATGNIGALHIAGYKQPYRLPVPFVLCVVMGILAALFLSRTIWGRYLFALGRNEQAARYSGINTDRMIILAYVLCALISGFGGLLFVLDLNSAQPASFGNFYELYAIAAAVLGGCSLRGGEGSIFGVILGAAVMRLLYNSINMLGLPTTLEFAIVGAVILVAVIADELVRRAASRRRLRRSIAAEAESAEE
ncbi:MAG: ABC transporter permease [Planctomycetota bacterium]|nr:MAG: ABC transporter permease [Planctomycetota bacterium]